ncbi:DUF5615 family PIN-like protein [Halovenus rubra]|uniref:DUF5615 family PIN-like protein n=2 Tax=Halovenus rubra TaxID=869890 RepID=A0ABD5X5B7_9EURY|nr:DUF5615 family PIN-like protein [Halovenus rubra]
MRTDDAGAVTESNEAGQEDQTDLVASETRGLVVLTNDDDFGRLGRKEPHAGIVCYSPQDHEPGDFAKAIKRIDHYFEPAAMHGHIEWIENWL